MRKSRQALEASLSQKVESKLLFSSKQTSTLSTQVLAKMDFLRQQEHLQREYNLKFMTDRKRNSTQKSQKSLSSSKVSHKEHKPKPPPTPVLQPQRLDFDSMDFRTKYYELHDEYIKERRKNIEKSQEWLALREALGAFFSNFDSGSGDEVCRIVEGEKLKQLVRRLVESRRKAEAGEKVLHEAMHILQVDSWDELVHNLRARVERFRNLDECTFKILELEAINKRVVNDFQQRLQQIREDQEQEWVREKQLMSEEIKSLQRARESFERQRETLKMQLQTVLIDISTLASAQGSCVLQSGRSEVNDLQRVLSSLRGRMEEIQVEAEENMLKLLRSNEQMMRLQRSISQLKGQLETQMQELQQKNEQNLCQINHLQAQLEQQELLAEQTKHQAALKQEDHQRQIQQEKDERTLLAAALGLTDCHHTKLLLAIKQKHEQTVSLVNQNAQLKATVCDKDKAISDLQAQAGRWGRVVQEAQETAKTALSEKEEYKFLLNNLRDQFSQIKRQHQEELVRAIRRKDEEIINSNRDILQSHAALTDQLAKLKADHTTLSLQHQEAKAALIHTRNRAEKAQRQLIEKEGVVKRLTAEGERFRRELREIQGSFRQVVDLEQVTSKRNISLQAEKSEATRACAALSTRSAELAKSNEQLSRERNTLRTELSVAHNDLKDLKEQRSKLEATIIELRVESLNRQAQITKLQESLKQTEAEVRILKNSSDKLSSQLNAVTRKLIAARSDIKKRICSKLKEALLSSKDLRNQCSTLKSTVKSQFFQSLDHLSTILPPCLAQISLLSQSKREENEHLESQSMQTQTESPIRAEPVHRECQIIIQTQQRQIQTHLLINEQESQTFHASSDESAQCQLMHSDTHQRVLAQLTHTLTSLSLLRAQQRDIIEAVQPLQSFNLEEIFRIVFQDSQASHLRALQGSIQAIREQSLEEGDSEFRDTAPLMAPDYILIEDEVREVNVILEALLEEDEVPSVPYWQKIESNFLAVRRKMSRKGNFKLDISAIDFKDPSSASPRSSIHNEADLFRRITTDPDDPFDPILSNRDRDIIANRSERFSPVQAFRRENQQLKGWLEQARARADQMAIRLEEREGQLGELRGQLVRLQNQTSIVGLSHNFKKVIEYLLNDNADLFLQTCRILMKMLHFQEKEIKNFEDQMLAKRKKKKGGLFSGIFAH